jgi:hypothetical protein
MSSGSRSVGRFEIAAVAFLKFKDYFAGEGLLSFKVRCPLPGRQTPPIESWSKPA